MIFNGQGFRDTLWIPYKKQRNFPVQTSRAPPCDRNSKTPESSRPPDADGIPNPSVSPNAHVTCPKKSGGLYGL